LATALHIASLAMKTVRSFIAVIIAVFIAVYLVVGLLFGALPALIGAAVDWLSALMR
jgi:hypothetical protein